MPPIPSSIHYEPVLVPDIGVSSDAAQGAVDAALLDFQGGRVALSSRSHIVSVLRLLHGIFDLADELVLESPSGERFLTPIRTHHSVIRDRGVVVDFAFLNPDAFTPGVDTEPYSLDLTHLPNTPNTCLLYTSDAADE